MGFASKTVNKLTGKVPVVGDVLSDIVPDIDISPSSFAKGVQYSNSKNNGVKRYGCITKRDYGQNNEVIAAGVNTIGKAIDAVNKISNSVSGAVSAIQGMIRSALSLPSNIVNSLLSMINAEIGNITSFLMDKALDLASAVLQVATAYVDKAIQSALSIISGQASAIYEALIGKNGSFIEGILALGAAGIDGYMKMLVGSLANIIGNIEKYALIVVQAQLKIVMKLFYSVKQPLISSVDKLFDEIKKEVCSFMPDLNKPTDINKAENPNHEIASSELKFQWWIGNFTTNKYISNSLVPDGIKNDKLVLAKADVTSNLINAVKSNMSAVDIYDASGAV